MRIKHVFFVLFLLMISCGSAFAQAGGGATGPATTIRFGVSDPATCAETGANVFYNTNTNLLKTCVSGSWVPITSGFTTGSGTTDTLPRWTSSTNIGDSIYKQGANAVDFSIGQVPSDAFIDFNLSNSLMRIGVGGRTINIGDRDNQGNATSLEVDDVTGVVSIGQWGGSAVNAPTTGINLLGANIKIASTLVTSIGDVDNLVNNSKLVVDDPNQKITSNVPIRLIPTGANTWQDITANASGNGIRIGSGVTFGTDGPSFQVFPDSNGFAGMYFDAGATGDIIFRDGFNGNTALKITHGTSNISFQKTITAGGTTGAQTINKTTGSVNFAAAATSLVVTNSLVSTSSIIQCTVATNDTTFKSAQCVAGSGSFTIFANAAATAETRVNFLITN